VVGWLLVSAVYAGPQPGGKVERPAGRTTLPLARTGAGWWDEKVPDDAVEMVSHAPIRALVWVRMTVSPDPGCSVRSAAVLQAHAETRACPVMAFSGADAGSSWMRTWKQRASSRRAIATVATFLPRR
jgi:hypothetical protein